jgi:hypothetical protein
VTVGAIAVSMPSRMRERMGWLMMTTTAPWIPLESPAPFIRYCVAQEEGRGGGPGVGEPMA